MPRRELWIELNGKVEVTGHVDQDFSYGSRILTTYPLTPINGDDLALAMCESQIRGWGFSIQIWADGRTRICLRKTDTYGPVLREVSRAYFLAINSPNPRRPT